MRIYKTGLCCTSLATIVDCTTPGLIVLQEHGPVVHKHNPRYLGNCNTKLDTTAGVTWAMCSRLDLPHRHGSPCAGIPSPVSSATWPTCSPLDLPRRRGSPCVGIPSLTSSAPWATCSQLDRLHRRGLSCAEISSSVSSVICASASLATWATCLPLVQSRRHSLPPLASFSPACHHPRVPRLF